MKVQDGNINGVLLSSAVRLASLVSKPLVPEKMHASFCVMIQLPGVVR